MTYIAVPSQKTFFVRTANQEAMANVPAGESLCISDLRFKRRQVSQRGTLESALRNGLFQTKFGVAYYQGYVDKLNQIGVEMDAPKMMFDQAETIVGPSRRDFAPVMEHSGLAPPNTAFSPKDDDAPFRRRRVAAVTLGAISATGYAAAIVLGALTLKTRNDYRDTTFERESSQLNTRYQHLGTGFWISSAAATVALVGAILIRPRKKNALPPTGGAHATGVNLRLHLDF